MLIGVDVDDVVADLVPRWLELYNRTYKDTLRVEQITSWQIVDFVKPECGNHIYDFLYNPFLYDGVMPIDGALGGVLSLKKDGHRIVFVTSCVRGMLDMKWDWLVRWDFLPNELHQSDLIAATDKSLIKVDILIDDRPDTILKFGRKGILFKRPWNPGVDDWETITEYFSWQNQADGCLT